MGVSVVMCMIVGGVVFLNVHLLGCFNLVLAWYTCLELSSCWSVKSGDGKVHLIVGGVVSRPMCVLSSIRFAESVLNFSLWPPCCICRCLSCEAICT